MNGIALELVVANLPVSGRPGPQACKRVTVLAPQLTQVLGASYSASSGGPDSNQIGCLRPHSL